MADVSDEVAAKRVDRAAKCTRGCSTVLSNLAKSYEEMGRHCWPTKMYCQNQVPAPVKGTGQYRNITGEYKYSPLKTARPRLH